MKPNPVKHATSSRLQQRKPQNNTQTILQRLRPQVPKCLKHDTLTVHNNTEASHISATRADTAPTPHSSDQKGVGTMAHTHTHRQANNELAERTRGEQRQPITHPQRPHENTHMRRSMPISFQCTKCRELKCEGAAYSATSET